MVKYFRANGCHCKDQLGQKCNVNLGSTFLSMFYHLAHIERQLQDYVVFKGRSHFELYSFDLFWFKTNFCSPLSLSATPAELSNYEALEKQAPNPKSQAAPQNRSFQHRQPSIRPAFAGPVNTSASWRQANPGLDSFASASSLNTTIGFRLPNLSNPTRAHRESGASTMDSFHQTPRSTTSDFPNRTTVNSFIRIDLAKASGLRSGHQIRPRLNSRMYYGKKIGPTLNAAWTMFSEHGSIKLFHTTQADHVKSGYSNKDPTKFQLSLWN